MHPFDSNLALIALITAMNKCNTNNMNIVHYIETLTNCLDKYMSPKMIYCGGFSKLRPAVVTNRQY